MKVSEIAERLGLACLTPDLATNAAQELTGGYASDLLSDVLAHAPRGGVLVTIQVHMNVVAVASHCELAAVIFAAGRRPDAELRQKATQEGVGLYSSPEAAFDIVGALYDLGLRGNAR